MKRSIYIMFYVSTMAIGQTTYYVDATSGRDSNPGTSKDAAWKTINHVEGQSFSAGDVILFKRGEIFRTNGASGGRQAGNLVLDSGKSGKRITYGAYGTGARPIITTAYEANDKGDWTNQGGNIWYTSYGQTTDVGNMVFNGTTFGVKEYAEVDLNAQGEFYYDGTSKRLKLYSKSNPAAFYSGEIEYYGRELAMDARARNYITIENLHIKNANFGVSMSSSNYINIQDCLFTNIGGALFSKKVRYGNGVELYGDGTNIVVQRNKFQNIYDAAMTAQGGREKAWTASNIYFLNNLINDAHYSAEIWYFNAGSNVDNIYFENNTCTDAGGDWATDLYRPAGDDNFPVHIMCFGSSSPDNSNWVIKNNIFDQSRQAALLMPSVATATNVFDIDYNIYYESAGNFAQIGIYSRQLYYAYSRGLGSWQSVVSQDSNSILGDPDLSGFVPTSSSIAIDAGTDTGRISTDFTNAPRPKNSVFDIGAYEVRND